MATRLSVSDQRGFTLIELISVMVIIGVIVTVAIRKYDVLSDTAAQSALWEGVKELNARETLTWAKIKLADPGWTSDADLFAQMDTDLGPDYAWTAGPTVAGGTLSFRSESIVLTRTPSTASSMGRWQ